MDAASGEVRGCFSGLKRGNFYPESRDFCLKNPDFGAKNHDMQTLPETWKRPTCVLIERLL